MVIQQFHQLGRLLQGQRPEGRAWWGVVGCLLVGAFLYGCAMGSFSGRPLLMLFSAVKLPLLLATVFLLSLPSFFVLNTLLGVRGDFGQVLAALIESQTVLTLTLLSLAPFTLFWYLSVDSYQGAVLFNGGMFLLAALAAQVRLRQRYRPLIARRAEHRWLLRLWLVVYAFVGVQMAWVLRPFIGAPSEPAQFFRAEAWDNAYVIVARTVWQALGR